MITGVYRFLSNVNKSPVVFIATTNISVGETST